MKSTKMCLRAYNVGLQCHLDVYCATLLVKVRTRHGKPLNSNSRGNGAPPHQLWVWGALLAPPAWSMAAP